MSRPPTDFARIELFCELVDEYDDLADAFPVAEPTLQLIPFSPEPATDRWARVVRAMALRKFAIGKRDEVYVPKVLDSVTTCLTDPTMAVNVESYRDGFRGLGLAIRTVESEGVETSAPEIIEDLIYGGLLHGDYDRHERMKVRPNMTHDLSLCSSPATWSTSSGNFERSSEGALNRASWRVPQSLTEGRRSVRHSAACRGRSQLLDLPR